MFFCVLLKRGVRPFPGRCTMAFGFRLPGPQSDCQTDRVDICQIISTKVIFVTLSNRGEGDVCQIVKDGSSKLYVLFSCLTSISPRYPENREM